MNTRILYEYRDAANFRFHGSVTLAGEMTPALWVRIRAACEDGEFFVAHQVGLPELFAAQPGRHVADPDYSATGYPYHDDLDHCWHRWPDDPHTWSLTTDAPTDPRTVEEFVRDVEAAFKAGWEVFDPAERLEG